MPGRRFDTCPYANASENRLAWIRGYTAGIQMITRIRKVGGRRGEALTDRKGHVYGRLIRVARLTDRRIGRVSALGGSVSASAGGKFPFSGRSLALDT